MKTKTLDAVKKTAANAAKHFEELYAEELAGGEVTPDAIFEWWGLTQDQYPANINYADIEKLILQASPEWS